MSKRRSPLRYARASLGVVLGDIEEGDAIDKPPPAPPTPTARKRPPLSGAAAEIAAARRGRSPTPEPPTLVPPSDTRH